MKRKGIFALAAIVFVTLVSASYLALDKPEPYDLQFWQVDQIARRNGFVPGLQSIGCGMVTVIGTHYTLQKSSLDIGALRDEILTVHPELKVTQTLDSLILEGSAGPNDDTVSLTLSQTGIPTHWQLETEFTYYETTDENRLISRIVHFINRRLP